ncbi:MAG: group II intron reverse transcriptase/maturase [Syntrophobacteraceae bacterium]
MSTDLTRIGEKARKEPHLVFTTLYHHVTDVDNLRACYDSLEAGKAKGVDGVSKEQYGKDLVPNLEDLSGRLKTMSYRPQPKRRTYVPKPGSAKGRPLGISSFEDKLVELAVKRVLEPIYEEVFEDSSYGYRPNRSSHECLDEMGRIIQQKGVNYVVEADIRSFFDRVNHEWVLKFLAHRIGDPRILRLISRMSKAGIMEDGLVRASEEGTPQGSILSPLLSNVYLHYALDLWFSRRFQKRCRGKAYYFRFADDFLACFQHESDAIEFRQQLEDRLQGFGLELALEKTRCIEFGRFARENARKKGQKPEEFNFLGFTHYCGKTKKGYFKLKRRTSRKKFGLSLNKFTEWALRFRSRLSKGQMLRQAKTRVAGHLSYYAITDNSERCTSYVYHATRILFKWINRKSQRPSYTWKSFQQALNHIGWPKPNIRKDLNPCRRAQAI